MVSIFCHRRNTIDQLRETPTEFGVEIDIRSKGDQLYLHHDPFAAGTPIDDWLTYFNHAGLILNVKEEGLEDRLTETMEELNCENYFFLDQSFPFLIRTSNAGEKKSAVRVSEYEGLAAAHALAGRIEWVWVDCFSKFPLSKADATELQALGYKLCIVSPELQGREDVRAYRAAIETAEINFDAVCTKYPDLWT